MFSGIASKIVMNAKKSTGTGTGTNTTLYYFTTDTSFGTVANWYLDSAGLVPAGRLPTASEDVIVGEPGVRGETLEADGQTVANITFFGNSFFGGTLIVTGVATFNEDSINFDTIIGNAIFNDFSANNGFIDGDVTFNDNSENEGNASGTITDNR